MKLGVSPRAQRDLNDIRDYWSSISRPVARRFMAAIRRGLAYFRSQPLSGRSMPDGSRSSIVLRTPFIINYDALGREVRVNRVWHGREDRPSLNEV